VIEKIISSGHTGPERAALDAALKYGVPHTGWIHYIPSEERDKLLNTYNLKVIPALDPRAAIRQNITHANGTLILAAGKSNKDSDYARYLTLKRGLQLLGIDPQQYSHIEAGSLIAAWMEMNRVSRVYITGSDDAALGCAYLPARKIIDAAVTISLAKPMHAPPRPVSVDTGHEGKKSWPVTIPEAVNRLVSDLFLRDKTRISAMTPIELDELHPTLGVYIKDTFGLLSGNHKLTKACMQTIHVDTMLPDEAAAIIIKELWKKLQVTHKLRIV
jgi:hypothetical protein